MLVDSNICSGDMCAAPIKTAIRGFALFALFALAHKANTQFTNNSQAIYEYVIMFSIV